MTYSVRFVRKGVEHHPFETTPFVAPDHSYEYDLRLPPNLVAIVRTWTVEGTAYGAAWERLKAKIEDPGNFPDGIELLRDSTVLESITVAGGYDDWRIERLSSSRTDLQWRGEHRFTMRIVGRRRLATKDKISDLKQTETWSYDEAGLLTRMLTGELDVTDGSAVTEARKLGLKLPGKTFAFVTNGPEGVDVERLDPGDLKARFTSTIRESGLALPDAVGPGFTLEVETAVRDGIQVTTTRVHGTGPGALAAVQAHLAPGRHHESISSDSHTRTAQGVFVEARPANGDQLLRMHRFSVAGGNRPMAFTRRTGGRVPAEHTLSFTAVDVTESIEVLTWGKPATGSIRLPSPVTGLTEDRDAWRLVGPERTTIGKDETADEWTTHVTRVYRAVSLTNVFTPVLQSVIAPGAGTTLEDEITRITKV